jgi:hypothetical protein
MVEPHDANGIQLRPPDIQPPIYNLALATINQEIFNINMTHPDSFIWILVGDNNYLPSNQDLQDVMSQIPIGTMLTHFLMEFHCYK